MLVPDVTDDHPNSSDSTLDTDRFVWPPQAVEVEGTPRRDANPLETEPRDRPASAFRDLLVASERVFLRPVVEPIDRQIAELGWSREAAEASCQRCGRSVGPHEEDEFGCARCRNTALAFDRAVRLGEYATPLDRWIWCLKFQRIRSFGVRLGSELGEALREAGALHSPPPGGVAIQAVPASFRRRWSRGIDHASVLADACAAELAIPRIRVLRRSHRRSQRSVASSDRWANAQGSVRVRESDQKHLVGKRIVVIDDVMTSGATARAVALALKGQPDARFRPAPWGAREVWHAVIASTE
jgi:predicted amidophosphoribosyltransferase